jgi:N-methylhydantoinase A/oxoprolinase/acetone carboxylase beta subunit
VLCAPKARTVVRSFAGHDLDAALVAIATEARALVGADAHVETAVDCRYVGQSHELTVPTPADFPAEHERRNGHARPGSPVEVVAVRARASLPAPLELVNLPEVTRTAVRGPSIVAEPDCTVWIPAGWHAEPRELGAWVLERR